MKFLIPILFTFYGIIFASPSLALYDPLSVPNNKSGVHILDPNEVSEVPALVNNNGGDWGYVIVPIQPSDRDQNKWQTFMHYCRDKHLIPIIRITTIPFGGTWDLAKDTDLVDFANFLAELDWPVENRYIVLFNEVNRDTEWGGTVNPGAYARIVKNAFSIFKERNRNFFMLGPALDSALPNSATSMSAGSYLRNMQSEDSAIWSYFDGWASHSYPNPAFSASPKKTGWMSIVSYRTELEVLNLAAKPVFITETGWDQNKVTPSTLESYWTQAFNIWNGDQTVVTYTPFVLQGGNQFQQFSLKTLDGQLRVSGQSLQNLTKTAGSPKLSEGDTAIQLPVSETKVTTSGSGSGFSSSPILLQIENFFRTLLGWQSKSYISVGSDSLTVEVADKAKSWEQGLSGREGLATDTGMLFKFPRNHIPIFWMKDMKFPIDIVWVRDNQIISIENAVPIPSGANLPTYSPAEPVNMVLEVPAGYAAVHGWQAGTEITIHD